jgi:7-keto-8-aminopelargonate synthetase-like enzyme
MREVQTGLDIAFQSLDQGRQRGVLHLYNESEYFDGRIVTVDGQQLINFGSCSYLGLEKDSRLVEGCVEAVRAYGTQFSTSRAYMSSGQYKELEGLFRSLFDKPVLVVPTTSLGHLSAFQALVGRDDVVVLDHQVHASVHAAAQYAKGNGTTVKMIRHNSLDHLEKLIIKYREPGRKIWYCIDGVYSMYGDLAPLDEIFALADKYPSLHIYADDAHGFSWYH